MGSKYSIPDSYTITVPDFDERIYITIPRSEYYEMKSKIEYLERKRILPIAQIENSTFELKGEIPVASLIEN